MLKRLISSMLVVVMVLAVSCTGVFAMIDDEKALTELEKANEKIEKFIENAINAGDEITEKDIEKLLDITNDTADKAIVKISRFGVEVECILIEVTIGGQTILIDPLRVIRA